MGSPRTERARLAALTRRGADPERIDQARRDLNEANLAAHIRRIVDGAPPLTDEQRERLALLLHPGDPPAQEGITAPCGGSRESRPRPTG